MIGGSLVGAVEANWNRVRSFSYENAWKQLMERGVVTKEKTMKVQLKYRGIPYTKTI